MSDMDKYKVNGQKQRPRIPMHAQRPLMVKERPGFKRYIMNDVPGRREQLELAGYTVVTAQEDNQCDKNINNGKHIGKELKLNVNKGRDAPAYTATVMEIPVEWWDEDNKARLDAEAKRIEALDPSKYRVNGSVYGSLKRGTLVESNEE